MVKFRLEGKDKLLKDVKVLVRDIKNDVGNIILEDVKESAPVNTGKLRKSFFIKMIGNVIRLISSEDYANIQDKGGNISISESMRKKYWALYYSTGLSKYKAMALTKVSNFIIHAKHYINLDRINNTINRYRNNKIL